MGHLRRSSDLHTHAPKLYALRREHACAHTVCYIILTKLFLNDKLYIHLTNTKAVLSDIKLWKNLFLTTWLNQV